MTTQDPTMTSAEMIVPQSAGLVGEHETATAAQAAQAHAMVRARFSLARMYPRNEDDARTALLRECARPSFAEVARYSRPVGKEKDPETGEWVDKFAEGMSIRFAEAAVRHLGNIDAGSLCLHDDANKRIVRVHAMDLQTNAGFSKDLTLAKTVERRTLKNGQQPLGKRQNSYGDTVYIVRAEESEFAVREAAEISKALRTLLLRLVPGWILDDCEKAVEVTQATENAKDPDTARLAMIDGFAKLGVKAADLAAFLGHPVDVVSPAELQHLRAIGTTIRDGELAWSDVMASKAPPGGDAKDPAAQRAAEVTDKVRRAADKLRKGGKAEPEAKAEEAAKPAETKPAEPTPEPKAEPAAKKTREPGEDG